MDVSLTPVVAVVASSVAESPRAGNTITAGGHWSEIQAMFADDPGASIELAAGLVHDRLGALVTSVKDRQQSRRSAWQGEDSGTEDLRMTLRHYRVFWHRPEDFPMNEHALLAATSPAAVSRAAESEQFRPARRQ
jgi:hypothetical protein